MYQLIMSSDCSAPLLVQDDVLPGNVVLLVMLAKSAGAPADSVFQGMPNAPLTCPLNSGSGSGSGSGSSQMVPKCSGNDIVTGVY
jgi:hypothetical protein